MRLLTVIPYLVAIAAVARASVEEPAHPDTKKDLFRGDFVAAFDHEMHSIDKFYGHVHGKKEVARLIPPYMLLRLAQLTESWAVTIVPWVLQAAATGGTQARHDSDSAEDFCRMKGTVLHSHGLDFHSSACFAIP